jgi:hypothetical protein
MVAKTVLVQHVVLGIYYVSQLCNDVGNHRLTLLLTDSLFFLGAILMAVYACH